MTLYNHLLELSAIPDIRDKFLFNNHINDVYLKLDSLDLELILHPYPYQKEHLM